MRRSTSVILFSNQQFHSKKRPTLRQKQKLLNMCRKLCVSMLSQAYLYFIRVSGQAPQRRVVPWKNGSKKLAGCDKDSGCVLELKPCSIYFLASHVFNEDSNQNEENGVCAFRTFLDMWVQKRGHKEIGSVDTKPSLPVSLSLSGSQNEEWLAIPLRNDLSWD